MTSSLHQRFSEAESAFLDALSSRGDVLDSFERQYSLLRYDLERACAEGSIDLNTAQYAHTVSSRIAQIAEGFQQFDNVCNELTIRFMDALEYHDKYAPGGSSTSISNRRDVALAAKWMAENYHNPYPSNTVRNRISQQANWNRKDVDGWFTDARKRMGWNDIRKQFCGNKRTEVVQKASDFFENQRTLSNPALESAFAQLSTRVQELFVEPFRPGQLALVPDSRKGDGAHATHEIVPTSCPSPTLCTNSPTRSAQKRRRSVDIEPEPGPKRSRRDESYHNTAPVQLPSPPMSQSELLATSPQTPEGAITLHTQPSSSTPPNSLPNRRRRLSYSAVEGRPHLPLSTPRLNRLQTVSAPALSSKNSETRHCSTSPTPLATEKQHLKVPDAPSSSPKPSYSQFPAALSALSAQNDEVHDIVPPAEIPSFSFELPGPVSCEQPANMPVVDLAFFDSVDPLFPPSLDDTMLSGLSMCGPTLIEHTGNSLYEFLGDHFNNQILPHLPPTIEPNQTAISLTRRDTLPDLAEIDNSLSSFPTFDPPQLDDLFFMNLFGSTPSSAVAPSSSTTALTNAERVKQLAQLEALRKQQSQLQACIRSLENQIGDLG